MRLPRPTTIEAALCGLLLFMGMWSASFIQALLFIVSGAIMGACVAWHLTTKWRNRL